MCNRPMPESSIDASGKRKEDFSDDGAGMVDVGEDRCYDCCGDVPGACEDVDVHKGSEDAGDDDAADDVVWGGHGGGCLDFLFSVKALFRNTLALPQSVQRSRQNKGNRTQAGSRTPMFCHSQPARKDARYFEPVL